MSLSQWATLFQSILVVIFMLTAALFARVRAQQVGREELLKSLTELRDQVADRDRTAIALRERIKDGETAIEALKQQSRQIEAQQQILVRENLELKVALEAWSQQQAREKAALNPPGRKKALPSQKEHP